MATHTTLLVTACDRGGHLIERIRITRRSENHRPAEEFCIADRAVAFRHLRAKHPDCQIYYDWNRASAEPLTEPLVGNPEYDADARGPVEPVASVMADITTAARAIPSFPTMEAAFAACRDHGKPMRAIVAGERYRLYPSGRADRVGSPRQSAA